jgi:hypothetical protein
VAQRTIVEYVDDLDGGEAAGTVSFQIDGRELEIDLNEENAGKLRGIFAPYVVAARRRSGRRRGSTADSASAAGRSRQESRKIRQWLWDNGYDLSDRGRIPSELVEAYRTGTTASDAEPGSELARYRAAAS